MVSTQSPAIAVGQGDTVANREDATALGNPAGTADTVLQDQSWTFKGKAIDPNVAAKQGLSCFEDEQPVTRCYQNSAAMERAERVAPMAKLGRSGKAIRRHRHSHDGSHHARAARHAHDPMRVYQHSWEAGWQLTLNTQCAWYDLQNNYNDEVSSYYMGNHSGHFSEHNAGNGYWYPGRTEAYWGDHSINNTYSNWNDRISSRYRRGC